LFADDLELYCRDPELRAKHGAAARAETGAYQWDAINQSVADTYVRLIRQKQRRGV
jgi:phosphatidylinositol alpha 1,6-mannosyltransferase